jgi:hypothetical protein
VIVLAVAVIAVPELREKALRLFGDPTTGTELIGDGDTKFLVAASAASELHRCTPQQALAEGRCDDLKFIKIDAARMPFIARNISTAWEAGKPGVLTKNNKAGEMANRKWVCRQSFPRPHGGQCDEFPFASTQQGGEGAQEHEVPPRENQCQGGTMVRQYATAQINDGDSFLVVVTNPDLIARGPYQGSDIAKVQAC